ncbi:MULTISPECIES: hypothetical protein [Bradyrhizobium]|uniref:hypothetical protein n=1 Tax=Bradyrhizobium TaxID=374 RepID=UPI00159FDA26|nr:MULTISPECIES: hypothetical protein [Bradyrhizobium]MCA6104370.1 hypothetical protein [Bradyrhizobium australafricanum]MCC8975233.1 hypothetical protein [Bradyrhizobium brasilense]
MRPSSHQLEQFEDICQPQLGTLRHVLEEQVSGVCGNLVPLERVVLSAERLHLGRVPGDLGRDFERLPGIMSRVCDSPAAPLESQLVLLSASRQMPRFFCLGWSFEFAIVDHSAIATFPNEEPTSHRASDKFHCNHHL